MAEPIVSAVIGCGRMGAFTSAGVRRYAPACWFPLSHCEAVKAHPALQLAAVCDPDAAARARAQEAHAVPRAFATHTELLQQVRPRLLCVATRTVGRAAIIADAIAAGVGALHVEKPLCSSVAELRQLESLLSGDAVALTLGAIRRHFRIYQQARALADSGAYGPLQEIRVNMGRGALYWVHPHSIDLILFAAGARRVSGVQARLLNVQRQGLNIESDPEVAAATVYFDDGVTGHIGRAPGADFVLACAEGEIAVENDGHALLLRAPADGNPYPQRRALPVEGASGGPEGTYAALAELAGCLLGDAAAQARNRSGRVAVLTGQRLLFALVQSHLEASRVVAPEAIDAGLVVQAMTGGRHA